MGTLLTRPPGHRRDVALRPAATAMVWIGEGHPHELIAVPGVALGDADVLVAVELSTICRTDVQTVSGLRTAPVPLVLGHESVGRVIAIGDLGALDASGAPLRIGDRVIWSTTISCGTCDRCAAGLAQLCRTLARYGNDRIGGHGELSGAFGSHVQLRAGTTIVRVPETLPAAMLAPASCAIATAWAAVSRAGRSLEGAAVRIHGAGLVGVSAAAIATESGARVEVLDPDPTRRAWAARFGATELDREPDMVIETTGDAVAEAVGGVVPGGTVVLADQPPSSAPVAFDAPRVVRDLITITGVHGCTAHELAETVTLLAGRGRAYPFAEAVGEVRLLSDLDEALAAASAPGAPLRIGVVPG